ncbi:hypothetical protein KIN20_008336 [Parelaphostrongylus tenuis]|uniref:Homeobox domain-containing protein n=1 Tax=Parelaphostrongylus tenuis TaxID=148309 RepID=A0AAD5QMM8_PARTN|nr:hypothetical protein KIN20_008336 [Parelaphostrongylus tenuis]
MENPLFSVTNILYGCEQVNSTKYQGVRNDESEFANRNYKEKKVRTSFTTNQIVMLEQRFASQKYLTSTERSSLAQELKMSDVQVKTWFQNRRTKWRRHESAMNEQHRRAVLPTLEPQSTASYQEGKERLGLLWAQLSA